MSGHDIFISYSREDRAAARHFADSFAGEGFSVWWDAVLRSGETFDEVIERELKAAKAVVVLWSPRSVASRWVRAEATLADRSNKLVPAIIETCTLPIIFELTHAAQLADWTGDTSDSRWQTLVSDLRRLVDSQNAAAATQPVVNPAPTPAPAADPQPAAPVERKESAQKPSPVSTEELVSSLARIGKPDSRSELLKPTATEDAHTQFYKASDDYRQQEGEEVHFLQRLDDDHEGIRFVVTSAGLKIGRTAPSDVILPHAGVSREHCLVELAAGKVRVTDLNSTNGTYVDDKRIKGSASLAVGSVLRVGNVLLEHEVQPRSEGQDARDPLEFGRETSPRVARFGR